MSLFQAREWWGTTQQDAAKTSPDEQDAVETFSSGAMILSNIDNDPSDRVKIVTGSHKGILRVFAPRQREFQVDDLLLETSLEDSQGNPDPILQLASGRFLSNGDGNALAVLQPKSLRVYELRGQGGGDASAPSFLHLTLAYKHTFKGGQLQHFSPYNMCFGPFAGGGPLRKDSICVQSMDCQIAVFEQDKLVFTKQLPPDIHLLPGPVAYLPSNDSLVFSSTDLCLCGYKYENLTSAASATHKTPGQKSTNKEAGGNAPELASDWSILLGEEIKGLNIGRYSSHLYPSQFEILAITDTGFFVINGDRASSWKKNKDVSESSGQHSPLKMQKRLNYHPCSACSYGTSGPYAGRQITDHDSARAERPQNIVIGNHAGMIEVYGSHQVLWAARTPIQPTVVSVECFGDLRGLIAMMDRHGTLSVCYLGTEPPTGAVGALAGSTKPLDYVAMDEEHRRLLKKIREAQSENKSTQRNKLTLRAEVPTRCEYGSTGSSAEQGFSSMKISNASSTGDVLPSICVALQLSYNGSEPINNLSLAIETPIGIRPEQSTYLVERLAAGGTRTVDIVFQALRQGIPQSLKVDVTASYQTQQGEPRISQCMLELPFAMACRIVRPIKNPVYKLTINTNQPPPPALSSFFQDMLGQRCLSDDERTAIEQAGVHVVSLRYYSGADVSILVSKNAGRYRIQGGMLEALWLAATQLVTRLERYFSSAGVSSGSTLEISYDEPLPLADFFRYIDSHFSARTQLASLRSQLNDRAAQFRSVQKRLLVRFRDRNPAPLSSLDKMLSSTHEELVQLADKAEECYSSIASSRNGLQCVIRLVALLIKLKYRMPEDDYNVLSDHLMPQVEDNNEQGWEERCDAALSYFLRNYLGVPQQARASNRVELPADTSELKNRIAILCDKLDRLGGKFESQTS
eukprot:gb/GECG01014740.1/.p1 GENE.gb/GECG01014740.1/~~gb/GECG01014740.1/.p1  ORF type:complete len:915 (+),score=84.97 gb/GECG01014740.1/:1-2745(+)